MVAELVQNPFIDDTSLSDLAAYGWDSDEELFTVTEADVRAILIRFRNGELSASQVRDWANRIEGRDDIGYEGGGEGIVNEAIFWLANPYINWPIDEALCRRIEDAFAKKNHGSTNNL